jgi:hypothetical protein
VLVVASDYVGSSMAGPGIRYLWFARELARRGHDVTLAVPFETDVEPDGFSVTVGNTWHAGWMTALCRQHDTVVAQRLPVPTMLALSRTGTKVVYDFYSPPTIEYSAFARTAGSQPSEEFELLQLTLRVALETGSAFVCASERQRDLCLGALSGIGRVDPVRYRADPTFRRFVDVVPFGVEPAAPTARRPVLKGVVPGIEATDRVALWGGGIWNWLDPLTVIRAVDRVGRPDLKLYFLGMKRPGLGISEMAMQSRAVALAEELGMLGSSVFFNAGWVPYEDRGSYLLEADVGVSAHFDELETRFAFRTRLLDCIWAGLPIVTTIGDSLSEMVREHDLGRTVEYEHVDGYAAAISAVLDCDRETFEPRFAELRRSLEWPRVVEPLAALIEGGHTPGRIRADRNAAYTARYLTLRGRLALRIRGLRGLAGRIASGDRRERFARTQNASDRPPEKP